MAFNRLCRGWNCCSFDDSFELPKAIEYTVTRQTSWKDAESELRDKTKLTVQVI